MIVVVSPYLGTFIQICQQLPYWFTCIVSTVKFYHLIYAIWCCREELCAPNTSTAASGIQTFRFGQDLQFEVFIQYKEYMCFVKCMEALRGMKLMHVTKDGKALTANIKVSFKQHSNNCGNTIYESLTLQ